MWRESTVHCVAPLSWSSPPTRLLKATACLKNVDLGTRHARPSAVASFVHSPTSLCNMRARTQLVELQLFHKKQQQAMNQGCSAFDAFPYERFSLYNARGGA